jgi:hypothetical protein
MTDINVGTISSDTAKEAFEALADMLEPAGYIIDNPDSYTKEEVVAELTSLRDVMAAIFGVTEVAIEMSMLTGAPVSDFTSLED